MVISNYFVDESGDPEVFGSGGKVLLGLPGCSRFFILGFLDVQNPKSLSSDLTALRINLLADPYFKRVSSMRARARKTAAKFHAKDDIPEVRKHVFELLRSREDIRLFAAVKNKQRVLEYALKRRKLDHAYRYSPNELYDLLTRRLFKQKLHLSSEYRINYAVRGNKPRTVAMKEALVTAQRRYLNERGLREATPIQAIPCHPDQVVCLQATDYFLWALYRMYSVRDERYLEYLWPSFRLVIDIDDTRHRDYGEYFTQENPLNIRTIDHPI